jgi:hypothetical protein
VQLSGPWISPSTWVALTTDYIIFRHGKNFQIKINIKEQFFSGGNKKIF